MMDDYRDQNLEELRAMKEEKKEELENYVQDILKGKEKNVAKIKNLKKEIARISTVISEKSKAEVK